MFSKAAIVNLALRRMGVSRVVASVDTERSEEAIQMAAAWDIERKVVLRAFPWPWATAYTTLALVDGSQEDPANRDWTYSYRYPADCLYARRIVTADGRAATTLPPPTFRVGRDAQGRLIYTDELEAQLEYTVDILEPEEFDPLFVSLLAWRLVMATGAALSRLEKVLDIGTSGWLRELPPAANVAANEDEMKRLADPDVVACAPQGLDALKAQRSSQPWSMVPSISTRKKARFGS